MLANVVMGQDLFLARTDTYLDEAATGFYQPSVISNATTNLASSLDPCDFKSWKYDADRQKKAKQRQKAGLPANYDADAFENELANLIVDKYHTDMTTALKDFTLQLSKRKPTKGADSGLLAALSSWLLFFNPELEPFANLIKNSKATAAAVKALLEEPGKGIKGATASSYLDYAIKINDKLARTVDHMKSHVVDARDAFAKQLKSAKDSKTRQAIRQRHYDAITALLSHQQSLRQLRNVMFGSFLKSARTVFKRWHLVGGVTRQCPGEKYDSYNLCTNGAVDDEAALLKQLFQWNPTCFNGLGLSEKCGSWSWRMVPSAGGGLRCSLSKREQSCGKLHITQGFPSSYLRKCDDF